MGSRLLHARRSFCDVLLSYFGFGLVTDHLAIFMVWTAEALNTAFEFLADAASPEFHGH
jgi:diacylglycerol kinase